MATPVKKAAPKVVAPKVTPAKVATPAVVERVEKIVHMAVSDLIVHKTNKGMFEPMEDSTFEALVADIKLRGVRTPIIITPEKEIVQGAERFRACKKAKVQTVPVIVRKYTNKADLVADIIRDNTLRRTLKRSDIAKLGKIVEDAVKEQGEVATPGRPKTVDVKVTPKQATATGAKYIPTQDKTAVAKAAKATGVSPSQYKNIKKAMSGPVSIAALVDQKKLPLTIGTAVSGLSKGARMQSEKLAVVHSLDMNALKVALEALIKSEKFNPDTVYKTSLGCIERLLTSVDDLDQVWDKLKKADRVNYVKRLRAALNKINLMKDRTKVEDEATATK